MRKKKVQRLAKGNAQVTAVVTNELLNDLDRAAKRMRWSRSALIGDLLSMAMEEWGSLMMTTDERATSLFHLIVADDPGAYYERQRQRAEDQLISNAENQTEEGRRNEKG